MAQHEIDQLSGVETTGHSWDGLKELNHPLPRWWLWTFYACIVWSIGYYFVYPSWPLISGYTTGFLGHSQRAEALADVAEGAKARTAKAGAFTTASLAEIKSTPALLEFAMAQGKAAFGDNCAPCHGSGATGGPGYPNLQDDDWLWGGTLDDIAKTITVGIRSTSEDTRNNIMPNFGKDGILEKKQIEQVADYVLSLSDPKVKTTDEAKQLFADNCASCHGDNGVGNAELGGPNLADKIWLYGGSRAEIIAQITQPKMGVMPTWGGRLDETTIKSLTVWVHSQGGGK
jgi:cytochrome c oxidase cbb3-type subunit 3